MSDISIPGVSSKYNTTKLVEDLVNAERIRLTRMENEAEKLETHRSTWQQINRNISNLQRATKNLYGFENPFTDKIVVSSNEKVLTATAGRTAVFDKYAITVKQIATSDRFLTPPMDRAFRMEKGKYTFTVGNQSITLQYPGGSVGDFARRLNNKGEDVVRAITVKDTPDTQVLMIEAISTGAANPLFFQDDAYDFAIRTGMMRASPSIEGSVTPALLAQNLLTVSGTPVPPQRVEINEEKIHIQPLTSLRIPFDKEIMAEDGLVFEYTYRTIELNDKDIVPSKPSKPKWPDAPSGQYRGITVKGGSNSIKLPFPAEEWTPPSRVDDWAIFKAEGRTETQALPPISQTTEFKTVSVESDKLPSGMQALLIENDNTHRSLEIKDIRLFNPSKQGGLEPTQAVGKAGDAIINFRGVEAKRSTNMIDDLVEGVTFNLKRPSTEPVDLEVGPNVEVAKEGLIQFVFSYNQLLTRIMVLTSYDKNVVDELTYLDDDQRIEMEEQLGRLKGNTTLAQIRSRLQNIVTNPYPTRADSELTLLVQMGISSNASSGISGSTIDYSKLRGYLEIDEEKLDSFLLTNIDAVKDLFGKDTTGDLFINEGIAKTLDAYLTPYTQTGGLTNNRILGIEKQIKDTEEEITDYEKYLEDYETNLKRQYGTMEALLNQLENSSKALDNFSQQQRGNQ